MEHNNLAIILAIKNLTATQVAKDIGISRNTITGIKNNGTAMIKFETLHKLVKYLGCSYDDLLDTEKFKEWKDCQKTNVISG